MGPRRTSFVGRGFTLIELVCSMTVMSVLSVLASRLLVGATEQYMSAVARAELSQELSCAMERIAVELRTVRLKDTSVPDLASMTASSIAWNGASGSESIALSGSDLVWTDSSGSAPLVRGVSAFDVRGYDDSAAALPSVPNSTQLRSVRRVRVTLTASRQGVTETLRTRVFLRMLVSGGGV